MKLLPAATFACFLLLTACGEEPTLEQQVIAAILEMEEHVENAHRGEFMEMVAEGFSGQHGALGRNEFRQYMFLQWNENQRLYAQLFPIYVEQLDTDKAVARFRALITGGRGLLPERGELYEIETGWQKLDGDWLLTSANWQGVQSGPD